MSNNLTLESFQAIMEHLSMPAYSIEVGPGNSASMLANLLKAEERKSEPMRLGGIPMRTSNLLPEGWAMFHDPKAQTRMFMNLATGQGFTVSDRTWDADLSKCFNHVP